MKNITLSLIFLIFSVTALSQLIIKEKPLALVYSGPGSCESWGEIPGCSEAAAYVAEKAGYQVEFIGPNDSITYRMTTAKLWMQPGGRARIQAEKMSPELKTWIKNFVKHGGSYVGFCAGGFMATEKFGWMTKNEQEDEIPFEADGLGFLPGKSWYYKEYNEELEKEKRPAKIISTVWSGQSRQVYWELGPYFLAESLTPDSKVISYYPQKDGSDDLKNIMTIYSKYGQGKIAITAVHPEAPQGWRDYYKIVDTDELDIDLAVDMVKWTTEK